MAAPPRRFTAAEMRRQLDPAAPGGHRVIALDVRLNLEPLAKAIGELGREAFKGYEISAALNVGIRKFSTASYRQLKADTKMVRNVSRLRRGVRLHLASKGQLEARYVIRDRNLRITKAYFDASYSNYGTAGAIARWGGGASPAGADWTSWDGHRLGKRTFGIKSKRPIFIRLRKNGSSSRKIDIVKGPNPAQMMRDHARTYEALLLSAAGAELNRQIERAYKRAE
ncbi:MAG: hypothetical protein AB7O57_02850, partial [Hyphomicrobiaceae bacterium]